MCDFLVTEIEKLAQQLILWLSWATCKPVEWRLLRLILTRICLKGSFQIAYASLHQPMLMCCGNGLCSVKWGGASDNVGVIMRWFQGGRRLLNSIKY